MTCAGCGTAVSADARFCGVCGRPTQNQPQNQPASSAPGAAALAANPALATDMTGRVIAGRYRILAKLGEGGMGAVFRAEQLSLKRVIALKLLRPDLSANIELVRRFNAEAELAAKLSHPHTVTLYDFGQDGDGTLFIAMELIAGRSLRQVLGPGQPLSLARAVAICAQICDSLGDAHSHGIVHRDLKPDNVMLSERGSKRDIVKVLDFGIAKLRDQRGDVTGVPITQAGALLGTPQYMAPEQIRSETVDGRADVYALGIILYEMLTGMLPFDAPSLMATLSCHLMDPPIPPSQRRPGVVIAPAVEQLLLAMLAKSPAERPASMDEVARQLTHIAQSEAQQARPAAPGAVASSLAGGPVPVGPAMTPAPPGQLQAAITAPPTSTPLPLAATGAASQAPMFQTPAPVVAASAVPVPAPTAVARIPPTPGKKSRRGRWLALLGVLLIGGAVAAFMLHRARSSSSEDEQSSPKPTDNGFVPTDFVITPTREIYDNDP